MPDKSFFEKLLNNTPFALILSGALLVVVAAAKGLPPLSIVVDELGWRVVLAVLGVTFTGIGLFVWWKENEALKEVSKKSLALKRQGNPVEEIRFNYQDSPTKHGWRILETPDETQLVIKHFVDGFVGKAIQIQSATRYAMDYAVKPLAEFGSIIEFTVRLDKRDGFVYALMSVHSKDNSHSKLVWLNFPVGSKQPYPHGDGSGEWGYPVKPIPLEGDWLLFQIDLKKAVEQTYGKAGWKFEQLKSFRFRGDLSVANISVFEEK